MTHFYREKHADGSVQFPTGIRYTDAIHFTDCPKCFAPRGFYCQAPKGRKSFTPHLRRVKEYSKFLKERTSGS